uniref:PIPK domain-containing protein n=1 Tax=Paramoeba aestuarina TaxID=180227 RepID=A0A7S4NRJ5_9EUKA|mmetsp:Transcript_23672/g.36923  ORF Transcript_23672/g.36923 Transcript_23672/m.36923 type:complete len:260 (+) Transcript_23672:3-782(+)
MGGLGVPLIDVVSTSRSGSIFFSTIDRRYMIKTIALEEDLLLRRILSSYWKHLCDYPNSLMTRFFGLHRMRGEGMRDMSFIVMDNVFFSKYSVHEQYDLKGSTVDRQVQIDSSLLSSVARKDLDFHYKIKLGHKRKAKFLEQVEKDCKWMENHNICDYSLLIGFHFLKKPIPKTEAAGNGNVAEEGERGIFKEFEGGMLSEDRDVIYFVGIIDTLTEYNLKKAGEHHLKSLFHDSTRISAMPPTPYRERFIRYVDSIVE